VVTTLFIFAFLAGLIDAVGGGGGLIQLPALLVFFPNAPLSLLFGTNKFASAWGTGLATVRYVRAIAIPWKTVLPAVVMAFLFSFLGARCVSLLNSEWMRPAVVVALAAVLLYTVLKPSAGTLHAPTRPQRSQAIASAMIGTTLGFYDGFFGPGTGSFIIFAFIALLGFDFLHASASSKLINLATNIAALCYFIPTGNVNYTLAIGMAAANMLGAIAGTKLALTKGSRFVRVVFIVMALGLLLRQVQQLLGS
jgi:uncharacterized membrane protein YfcA